jgi:acyl carrier protein
VILGGEMLPWDFADTLLRASACRILDHYGPTETTVGATTFEVTAASMAAYRPITGTGVPIGRPLPNVHLAILDRGFQPVPVGVPGELFISGDGVADGYVGRPELTRQAFMTPADGRRAYRTGDRVRWRPDGVVEFLGRADRQVKIRGYRVELADVEHAIAMHPAVEQAVVVVSASADGGATELVAYVVARAERKTGYAAAHASTNGDSLERALMDFIAERLPEHMRPGAIVRLDAMPLTANGKIDFAALPAPDGAEKASVRFVEPRTETERGVASIWSEVLKNENVGATDDFIALGGHSLLAIRILGKITRQFGVRLPLRTLFDAPTVEKLAAAIDRERAAPAAEAPAITARARDAFRIGAPSVQPGTSGSGEQR